MTPNDLIKLALKMTGVVGQGQTPAAEDMNDAFALLNMMLGQWNRKRWLIYHLMDIAVPCTGALTYSIGPGGTINVGARPDRIEAAFLRQTTQAPPNQVDFPLNPIHSYEDWARIPNKQQPGFPSRVFLDTGAPLGTLYVWPVPSNLYELHLVLRAPLVAFAKISDAFTLPAEYEEAILYNLAGRLFPAYRLPPDPSVTALATAALNTIRNANAQIPVLRLPSNLTRNGVYNPYSDQVL